MTTAAEIQHLQQHGLYSSGNEHDACGLGFVAHIKGIKRHDIVTQALKILENIDHRGAVGADPLMGDGAGILIQIPDALYREEMAKQGVTLPAAGEYGVGMIFLPKEHASRLACEQEMERAIKAEGQVLIGWRDVPVNREMPMSPTVRAKEPVLKQIFIGRGPDVIVPDALERKAPSWASELAWQWVFPARRPYRDSASGDLRRHHLHETAVQRRIKRAVAELARRMGDAAS